MIAAGNGFAHVVVVLLNKGANPSIADDGGFTALHGSAIQGHAAVAKMFIKAGAPVDATTNGFTPLHASAREGHWDVTTLCSRQAQIPTAEHPMEKPRCSLRLVKDMWRLPGYSCPLRRVRCYPRPTVKGICSSRWK